MQHAPSTMKQADRYHLLLLAELDCLLNLLVMVFDRRLGHSRLRHLAHGSLAAVAGGVDRR